MSEKMREALEFYADPTRYHGPNQRNDHADKWSGESPYIRDVTRDGGAIARAALAEQPAQGDPDTDYPMSDRQVQQWIDACNSDAAKAVLREYLTLRKQPAQGKRAYYETHEPPHCPTCGCGLDAPPAPSVPADWPRWVSSAYQTLRKHNSSIPDDVLDQMRDMLAAAPAVPHG